MKLPRTLVFALSILTQNTGMANAQFDLVVPISTTPNATSPSTPPLTSDSPSDVPSEVPSDVPSDLPSRTPSTLPTVPPLRTFPPFFGAECELQKANLTACYEAFQMPNYGANCDSCISGVLTDFDNASDSCGSRRDALCQALDGGSCACGPCVGRMKEWLNCVVALGSDDGMPCPLDCTRESTSPSPSAPNFTPPFSTSRTPTLRPVSAPASPPTASPTDRKSQRPSYNPANACSSQEEVLTTCFADRLREDAAACSECFTSNIPPLISGCPQLESTICHAVQACPCGGCATELEAFLDCSFVLAAVHCRIQCR